MADTLITGTTIIEDKRTGIGEVWSCAGNHFHAGDPDTNTITYVGVNNGEVISDGDGIVFFAHVALPHGVTITSVIVLGNTAAQAETYNLVKSTINGTSISSTIMATNNIGSEDTSITSPIIDNKNNSYYLTTSSLDTSDRIHGAIIKYTV